jgi:hypothetical protein
VLEQQGSIEPRERAAAFHKPVADALVADHGIAPDRANVAPMAAARPERTMAAAGAEGDQLLKPATGTRADPQIGLPSFGLALTAPPAGLRLTDDPSRSIVEARSGGHLGNVGGDQS